MPADLALTLVNLEDKITDVLDVLVTSVEAGCLSSEVMLDMCTQLRRMGIGCLFLDADLEGFVSNLFRSCRCYVSLLETAAGSPSIDRYYLCLGRAYPLFDAIAIGDDAAVQAIATSAETTWLPYYEEEDNFWYVRCLLEHVTGRHEMETCLSAFEASIGDAATDRLEICEALWQKDEDAYWDSVYALLDEQATKHLEAFQTDVLEQDYAATESHCSIEGVALVKLGQNAGFTAGTSDFPLVPSFALRADLAKFPQTDPWPEVWHRIRQLR